MSQAKTPTDSEILNWLDKQTGTYTGAVIFRMSTTGRGWRLHETDRPDAFATVREAVIAAMAAAAKAAESVRCEACGLLQARALKPGPIPCKRCGLELHGTYNG